MHRQDAYAPSAYAPSGFAPARYYTSNTGIVITDIFYAIAIMGFIANKPIPTFILPKASLPSEHSIDDLGSITFPCMQDAILWMIGKDFKKHMNMIGHGYESMELVATAIEEPHGGFNFTADSLVFHNAFAATGIEKRFHFDGNLFTIKTKGSLIPRLGMIAQKGFLCFFYFAQLGLWKRIR